MGWVKLDDQFSRHPKVLRAGPLAGWLHVCALTYCAQYLTDGFVPMAAVNGLADFSGIAMPPFKGHRGRTTNTPEGLDFAPELVEAGMWEEVEGGYMIHDYLDFNPSRNDVLRKRRADTERKKNPEEVVVVSARNPNGIVSESKPPVPLPRLTTAKAVSSVSTDAAVSPSAQTDDPVAVVYQHYRTRVQPGSRLCPRKKIASRLKRFTAEQLIAGIDHFADDWWRMKNNVSGYGADWFFASDARAEQWLLLEPRAEPLPFAARNGHAPPPEAPRRILDLTGTDT